MNLSKTERNIVKLFFHPRLIKYLDKYVVSMVHNPSRRHVEFACNHSHSLRHRMCDNGHVRMLEWMRDMNLHIVAGNCGVVDTNDTHVLALDMILAEPPGHERHVGDSPLTLCTVVLNARASANELQRAHNHAQRIHSLVNNSYLLRCRSVLLLWGSNNAFKEVWFLS
jgi:hypothetical protein